QLFAKPRGQSPAPDGYTLREEAVPAVEQHQHGKVVAWQSLVVPGRSLLSLGELEPVEPISMECQQVGQLTDRGERRPSDQFDRDRAFRLGQINFDRLGGACEVE